MTRPPNVSSLPEPPRTSRFWRAMPPGRRVDWPMASLLALSIAIILAGQASTELVTMDDFRVVEVAREMLRGGDYVVPHLAARPFGEKSPGFPRDRAALVGADDAPEIVDSALVPAARREGIVLESRLRVRLHDGRPLALLGTGPPEAEFRGDRPGPRVFPV